MAKVIALNNLTRLDVPAERVLQAALEADLDAVVVIGYDKGGDEHFASSLADGGDVLWLLKRCEQELFKHQGRHQE